VSRAEWKFQEAHRDNLFRRLELPRRDAGSFFALLVCIGGAVSTVALGYILAVFR
jgi:hypothetical protein